MCIQSTILCCPFKKYKKVDFTLCDFCHNKNKLIMTPRNVYHSSLNTAFGERLFALMYLLGLNGLFGGKGNYYMVS